MSSPSICSGVLSGAALFRINPGTFLLPDIVLILWVVESDVLNLDVLIRMIRIGWFEL
jgi:hypothetical protein